MFSYHPDRSRIGDHRWYAKGWKTYASDDARILSRAILSCKTSPIIFKDGWRRKENFLAAHWIALDFDSPKSSIDEIEDIFSRSVHVLGTTKSHRIKKGTAPACDRFRLWLKACRPINVSLDYEATVRSFVNRYNSDPQCIDAARMFDPCKKIITYSNSGLLVDVVPGEEKKYSPLNASDEKFSKRIPPWVQSWLDGNLDDGKGRNELCFRTASWLTRNGYTEDEIVEEIMKSKLPLGEGCRTEVRYAVKSGRAAALRGMSGDRAASEVPQTNQTNQSLRRDKAK